MHLEYIMNPKNSTIRKKKTLSHLTKNFMREDTQMANKHIKRCSISLVFRETSYNHAKIPLNIHLEWGWKTHSTKNKGLEKNSKLEISHVTGLPRCLVVKNLPVNSGVMGLISLKREWQHTPGFLPGKSSINKRSLVGHKDLDMIEQLSTYMVVKSCSTRDPMHYSLQGSSVHEILQARILEWVVISFFRRSFPPRNQSHVSCIAGRLFTDSAKSTHIIG